MSQSKRGKVRAQLRRHKQAAQELARLEESTLLGGLRFDVHAARAHARSLIALYAEQAAFEDWTRTQVKGPENRESGAFVRGSITRCLDSGVLTLEGTLKSAQITYAPSGVTVEAELVRGGWPGKLARQWGGDSRAPMGRAYAKLGRRILDALEGQPDECRACDGEGALEVATHACLSVVRPGPTVLPRGHTLDMKPDGSVVERAQCQVCRGSGHNLRGYLPPVEWNAQVRRKVADASRAVQHCDVRLAPWMRTVAESVSDSPSGSAGPWQWRTQTPRKGRPWTGDTRVVPRGDHRVLCMFAAGAKPSTLDERITDRGILERTAPERDERASIVTPRWRRGELRAGQA